MRLLCKITGWIGLLQCLLLFFTEVQTTSRINNLEELVNSHSQTIRNFNMYLMKTEQLWRWYSRSHRTPTAHTASEDDGGGSEVMHQLQELQQRLLAMENVQRDQQSALNEKATSQSAANAVLQQTLLDQSDLIHRLERQLDDSTANVVMFVRQMAGSSNKSVQQLSGHLQGLSSRIDQREAAMSTILLKLRNNIAGHYEEMKSQGFDLLRKIIFLGNTQNISTENTFAINSTVNDIQNNIEYLTNKTNEYNELKEALENLKAEVDQFTSNSSNNTQYFLQFKENLQERMEIIEGQMNETAGGSSRVNIARIEHELTTLSTAIDRYPHFSSQLSALQGKVLNLNSHFESVREDVSSVSTRSIHMNTSVAEIQDKLRSLYSSDSHIDGRLRAMEGQFTHLQTMTNNLTERMIDTTTTDTTNLQELQGRVAALEVKVDQKSTMRIRGDALMRNRFNRGNAESINSINSVIENIPSGLRDHLIESIGRG